MTIEARETFDRLMYREFQSLADEIINDCKDPSVSYNNALGKVIARLRILRELIDSVNNA